MDRRTFHGLALGAAASGSAWAQAPKAQKTLRYAFRAPETSFDPIKATDIYSRTVTAHIFEALYTYDHLARPVKFKPLIAEGMPEPSDDFKVWRVKLRSGVYFPSDAAFKGQRREVVAEDFVYAIKRYADPKNVSPIWSYIESQKFVGLAELRKAASEGKAFDYDTPIPGLRALDRTTIEFRLGKSSPRFIEVLAASDLLGAVAREVVEHYGKDIDSHPVGTGPFRLAQWRRSSLIVLERNAEYRERYYDGEPTAEDTEGQALLAQFKGRRIPIIDKVEISIIEEGQPRWLSFLNEEHNLMQEVPPEFISLAFPNGHVAPNLAKQGVRGTRVVNADYFATIFNMEDPVVGGYTPERVALRRALSLGMDVEREIRLIQRDQALIAQASVAPQTASFMPNFRSGMSEYSPTRARALLDVYGYVDRNGDGWREQPDGKPLVLNWSMEDDQRGRQRSEMWLKDMKALGIKVEFKSGKWPELLKAARAGNFQIWHVGGSSASPDSQGALQRYDSKQIGGQNMARFKRPEMDAIYDKLSEMPSGPERDKLFVEAWRIGAAWMPYKARYHSLRTDLVHKGVLGYRRPVFWQDFWQYVDVVS
jgi:ABC-type transport system substrate-binding protein